MNADLKVLSFSRLQKPITASKESLGQGTLGFLGLQKEKMPWDCLDETIGSLKPWTEEIQPCLLVQDAFLKLTCAASLPEAF